MTSRRPAPRPTPVRERLRRLDDRHRKRMFPQAGAAALVLVLLTVTLATAASASQVVVEERMLHLDHLDIDVRIEDHLATTTLAFGFDNPTDHAIESHLTVPLSDTAVLTAFRLETHNETYVGIVQERQAAHRTYTTAQEAGQAAVLLDSAGDGLLALRFNLPTGTQATLTATYVEALPLVHDTRTYTLPLQAIGHRYGTIDRVEADITVTQAHGWDRFDVTGLPMKASAGDDADTDIRLTFDAEAYRPTADLVVEIDPTREGYVSTAVLSRAHGDAEALFTLAPPTDGTRVLPKDIVFLLDVSGSMEGDKLADAKAALVTILDQLRPEDRFQVIAFSDDTQGEGALRPADADDIQAEQDWVRDRKIVGGTNIEAALRAGLETLVHPEGARVPMLVLVTDGQPTAGVTRFGAILESVAAHDDHDARIHTVGIGFDQDDVFLSALAERHRGVYEAVPGHGHVQAALEGFYDRIGSAVIRDVTVEGVDTPLHDIHPDPLPDLYQGSEILFGARLDADALAAQGIRLLVRGHTEDGPFHANITVQADHVRIRDEAGKLWARQKAHTLEQRLAIDSDDHDADRERLLVLGLEHQIATLATSWVIVPADEVEHNGTKANDPSGQDDGQGEDAALAGASGSTATATSTDTEASMEGADDVAYDRSGGGGVGGPQGYIRDADQEASGDEMPTPAPGVALLLVALGILAMAVRGRRD